MALAAVGFGAALWHQCKLPDAYERKEIGLVRGLSYIIAALAALLHGLRNTRYPTLTDAADRPNDNAIAPLAFSP